MGRSGGRELVAVHVGEGDTAFFDHGSFGENTGAAAPAGGPGPFIGGKGCSAIFLLKTSTNLVLQREQVVADGVEIGCGGHAEMNLRERERERERYL